mmetsp:Transcript_15110/g.22864  ORF Transcript_15110/g.22864 Transcript_15110/m.22864 type:complete len:370 (-) Transcript_15110:80-1189(-)
MKQVNGFLRRVNARTAWVQCRQVLCVVVTIVHVLREARQQSHLLGSLNKRRTTIELRRLHHVRASRRLQSHQHHRDKSLQERLLINGKFSDRFATLNPVKNVAIIIKRCHSFHSVRGQSRSVNAPVSSRVGIRQQGVDVRLWIGAQRHHTIQIRVRIQRIHHDWHLRCVRSVRHKYARVVLIHRVIASKTAIEHTVVVTTLMVEHEEFSTAILRLQMQACIIASHIVRLSDKHCCTKLLPVVNTRVERAHFNLLLCHRRNIVVDHRVRQCDGQSINVIHVDCVHDQLGHRVQVELIRILNVAVHSAKRLTCSRCCGTRQLPKEIVVSTMVNLYQSDCRTIDAAIRAKLVRRRPIRSKRSLFWLTLRCRI